MSKVSTPSRPAATAAKAPPSTPVAALPVENGAFTCRDAAIEARDAVSALAFNTPPKNAPVDNGFNAKQFKGHNSRQVNVVLSDIATHANTLLHFVRNVGELDKETAFEMVAMGLQIIGASADQLAGTTSVGGPCEWLVGDVFYDAGKAAQA